MWPCIMKSPSCFWCVHQVYIHILILTSMPLGNWKPGEIPTKELLTLISSRIEMQKKSGVISEAGNPQVPSLLLEEEQSFFWGGRSRKIPIFPQMLEMRATLPVLYKKEEIFSQIWKFHHGVSLCCFRCYQVHVALQKHVTLSLCLFTVFFWRTNH